MSGSAVLTGFDLCRAAMAVTQISAPEQSVLLVLAIMSNEHAQCWPAITGDAGLTGKTKLSERSVQRSVQSLRDAGHINWVDKPGKGRIYIVHPRHAVAPVTVAPLETSPPPQWHPRHADTGATQAPTPATVAPNLPISTIPQKASPSSRARAELGSVLPDGWRPSTLGRDTDAGQIVEARGQGWAKRALETFENHWRAKSGKDARKRNWQATWANWVIEQDRRDGNARSRPANDGIGRTAAAAIAVFGQPSTH